jgi:two-component sensor histidine kinase
MGPARRLALAWTERTSSRAVSAGDPARIGYGGQLIERALPYSLGAETSYVLDEDGVRCTINLPLDKSRPRKAR